MAHQASTRPSDCFTDSGHIDRETEATDCPDYCKTITIRDTNGALKRFVFPKALDLDRPKRARTTFSNRQLELLETEFQANQYLVGKERTDLAKRLGLSETQVKVWFQNRRTKFKKDKERQSLRTDSVAESLATKSVLRLLEYKTPVTFSSSTSSLVQASSSEDSHDQQLSHGHQQQQQQQQQPKQQQPHHHGLMSGGSLHTSISSQAHTMNAMHWSSDQSHDQMSFANRSNQLGMDLQGILNTKEATPSNRFVESTDPNMIFKYSDSYRSQQFSHSNSSPSYLNGGASPPNLFQTSSTLGLHPTIASHSSNGAFGAVPGKSLTSGEGNVQRHFHIPQRQPLYRRDMMQFCFQGFRF